MNFASLWNLSPASLVSGIRRRLTRPPRQPGWHVVKAGPAAGAKLFLPFVEGAFKEMVEGTFDTFLYEALPTRDLKGKVCWDIGAHIGYHTLGFASLGAEVVAFEPTAENAERLRLHVAENPGLAARIRVNEIALSDTDGEATFRKCANISTGSTGSHLTAGTPPIQGPKAYSTYEQITVPTFRIDTLCGQKGEAVPDIMKIDVEGAEWLVLQGGRGILAKHKPVLLMEVHHIRLMFYIQRFLVELGYTSRILEEEHAEASRCFIMAIPGNEAAISSRG